MANAPSYFTLANGLRVVARQVDSAAEYCGLAVMAGSRNESPETYGLAHFVEHTLFKGTARRRSWHILNRMESVGGELNAYTTEETTVVYSMFPRGHLDRATELLADLAENSRFPSAQLQKEREVVLEEIDSYLDTPSDAIFDDFNELLFAGSSLGHNILGTQQTLATFTPELCRDFLERWYTPANMVFFYLGPETPDRVADVVERRMGAFVRQPSEVVLATPPVAERFDVVRRRDCHQSHTVIGARLPGLFSPLHMPFALLNNIIGGPCMNSLLNIALRERHAYVYSTDAGLAWFSDCGAMTIYFGCGSEHVKACRRQVMNILDGLAQSTMSRRALDAAKRQYVGQLTVAADSREQTALDMARATLYRRTAATTDEVRRRVLDITAEELRSAAELVAPDCCSVLTYN